MSEEVSKIWVNASACHIRLRLLGGSVSQCQPYGNYRWKLTSNWRPRATIWSGRPPVLITLNRGCSAPRHCRRRGRKADKWEEPLLICSSHQNLSFHIIFHHIKTKIIANDWWQGKADKWEAARDLFSFAPLIKTYLFLSYFIISYQNKDHCQWLVTRNTYILLRTQRTLPPPPRPLSIPSGQCSPSIYDLL